MRNSMARQQGITLIEVSIALIVAAVVAAAAFLLFSQNLERQDARDTTALMTNVVSDLRAKFGKQGGYVGLTTEGAYGAGVLAESTFNVPTGTPPVAAPKNTNFFTSLGVTETNGVATVSVVLNADNANCAEVATAMISGGAATVSVGATPVTTPGGAATACGAAGASKTVSATLNTES